MPLPRPWSVRAGAPLGRRYFAFLALAERHPEGAWPLFERYLVTPGAHHAFVAAAVEAARYYPGHADVLVRLFERIRGDQLLRRFLGSKILESLYVLGDQAALPLLEELLVTGHTDPDPDRCEVTRALVAVRKLTGRLAPSAKFPDAADPAVDRKSTRLNSSHGYISYAVFCLKKKKTRIGFLSAIIKKNINIKDY